MPVTFVNKPTSKLSGVAQEAVPGKCEASKDGDTVKEHSKKPTPLRNDLLPKIEFEIVSLADLTPAGYPVRKPSNRQVGRAARSIGRFGFQDPILVSTDLEIIDGHTRIEAARRLGLKKIPCIITHELSDNDIRLLRIAKNRIQERGEWDEQALKLEFIYMLEFEPDLSVTGFEAPEIDRIIVLDELGAGEADPLDKLQELPSPDAAAVTQPKRHPKRRYEM